MQATIAIQTRVTEEDYRLITERAKRECHSRSQLLRYIVQEWCREQELLQGETEDVKQNADGSDVQPSREVKVRGDPLETLSQS